MANEKQLAILKKGVKVWNEWRKENRNMDIDLQDADLSKLNLSKVDFQGANLQRVKLYLSRLVEANLQGVDLLNSNLRQANLQRANLRKAKLQFARLQKANLNEAILQRANLQGTNLQGADLQGAILEDAVIIRIDFSGSNLQGVNLRRAEILNTNLEGVYLQGADLQGASLQMVNLIYAGLRKAKFSGAKLSLVDLKGADLQEAKLNFVNFLLSDLRNAGLQNADITGANLYGTARFGWKIEGIKCDYIFFDQAGRIREPKNRDFEPDEFERLYKTVPTIEVIFEKGMNAFDPALLAYIAKESEETNPHLGLVLNEIKLRGLQPSAVFEIAAESIRTEAEDYVPNRLDEIKQDKPSIKKILKIFKKQLDEKDKQIDKLIEVMSNKREINTGGGNYYEKSTHNEAHKGNQTIVEKIENIHYYPNAGVSKEEFEELKSQIVKLKKSELGEIVKIYEDEKDKDSIGEKIKLFLVKNGINIGSGITAAYLFELFKPLLPGL